MHVIDRRAIEAAINHFQPVAAASSRDAALKFLDRALAIDPALAPALAHRALLIAGSVPLSGEPRLRLRPAGRLQQALAVHEQCYRRAPADGFTLHELVLTHSLLVNDIETPHFLNLSRTVSGISEPPWDVQLALARAAVRRRDMAQAARLAGDALPRALESAGGHGVLAALHAALEYDASLGDFDLACASLEGLLFGAGGQASVELSDLWMPEMQSFREHAGVARVLARLGLPMQEGRQHRATCNRAWPALRIISLPLSVAACP